jgi:ribosomal RNA-processing protein 12
MNSDPFANVRGDHTKHEHKRRVAAVLTAIEEAIAERRQASGASSAASSLPSVTEYFAMLMVALESASGAHVNDLIYLLSRVMPALPHAVLRRKDADVASALTALLARATAAGVAEDGMATALMRSTVGCVTAFLCALDARSPSWARGATVALVGSMLNASTSLQLRPKLRGIARKAIASVLHAQAGATAASAAAGVQLPLGALTTSFLRQSLRGSNGPSTSRKTAERTALLLNFAETILPLLDVVTAHAIAAELLELLSAKRITVAALRAVVSVFKQPHDDAALVRALIKRAPGRSDAGAAPVFCGAVAAAVRSLVAGPGSAAGTNGDAVSAVFRLAIDALFPYLNSAGLASSARGAVEEPAARALQQIFIACIDARAVRIAVAAAASVDAATAFSSASAAAMPSTLYLVGRATDLADAKYQSAWHVVLPIILSALVEHVGPVGVGDAVSAATLFSTACARLGVLRETVAAAPDGSATKEELSAILDAALGTMLRAVGPEHFLRVLPISPNNEDGTANDAVIPRQREWILPFLADHCRSTRCPLSVFDSTLLPIASACNQSSLVESGSSAFKARQRRMAAQIWALFPAVCAHPAPGSAAVFASLARKLAFALGDKSYPAETLQASVCRGLRALIVRAAPRMAKHRAWNEEEEAEAGAAGGGADEDDDGGADVVTTKLLSTLGGAAHSSGSGSAAERSMGELESAKGLADALAPLGKNFIPLLFNLLDAAHGVWKETAPGTATPASSGHGLGGSPDAIAHISETIRCYACVARPQLLAKLCKQVATKLAQGNAKLGASADINATRSTTVLLSIATALIASGSLPAQAAWGFYQTFAPLLNDGHAPVIQKRAYLCLEELCRHHVVLSARSEQLPAEAIGILSVALRGSLVSCSARSKMRRLRCLEMLITSNRLVLDDVAAGEGEESGGDAGQVMAALVGEVVLCTKESNNKTRAAAYSVLIALGKHCGAAAQANDGRPSLVDLFNMVHGALAAVTAHMRSAAVNSLGVLLFRFSRTPEIAALAPEILRTIVLLLREKAKEVVKSAIGFVRSACKVIDGETLTTMLPEVVEGLMVWASESKNRFRQKIRTILEILAKKCGIALLEPLVPERHQKLISHVRRMESRKVRKKSGAAKGSDAGSKYSRGSKYAEAALEGIAGARLGQSSAVAALEGGAVEDPMNLLDHASANRAAAPVALGKRRRGRDDDGDDDDDDADLPLTEDGRMIIPDEMDVAAAEEAAAAAAAAADAAARQGGNKRRRTGRGASGGLEDAMRKRDPRGKKGAKRTGASYASEKSGGDVQRKSQKLEPFAYIQLSSKYLSKRCVQYYLNSLPFPFSFSRSLLAHRTTRLLTFPSTLSPSSPPRPQE